MSRRRIPRSPFALLGLVLALSVPVRPAGAGSEPIFDGEADPRAEIRAVAPRAQEEGKSILLVFGAEWCPWCQRLHELFSTPGKLSEVVAERYEVVWVDVGQWDKNVSFAANYNVNLSQSGIPHLTLLGADRRWRANHSPTEFESRQDPPDYDADKLAEFLAAWPASGSD